jgi:GTPase SAR1 family protein
MKVLTVSSILVDDVTSMESFRALKSWLAEIKESMPDDAIIQVVGAKSDLEAKREVS